MEALRSSHYVEHCVDLIAFMNECHRILRPGGELLIFHPYAHGNGAWQDPTHVRALNEMSWMYYSADWRREQGLTHYPITADFDVDFIEYQLNPDWQTRYASMKARVAPNDHNVILLDAHTQADLAIAKAIRNGVNVVDNLKVRLVKR